MRIVATVTLLLSLVAADVATAAPRARLKAFSSCKDLVGYARDGALRTRGGVGVVGRAVPPPAIDIATPQIAPMPPVMDTTTTTTHRCLRRPRSRCRARGAGVGGSVPEFSGTNTQEADVDEPDVVKTDGRRIVVVTDSTLRVISPDGVVTGTLALAGADHRLLMRGDRVLAIATKGASAETIVGRPVAPRSAPQAEHHHRHRDRHLRRAQGAAHDGGRGPFHRRAPERRRGPARDRFRAGADHPRRRRLARDRGREGGRQPLPRPRRRSRARSAGARSGASSRPATPSRTRRGSPASTCWRS